MIAGLDLLRVRVELIVHQRNLERSERKRQVATQALNNPSRRRPNQRKALSQHRNILRTRIATQFLFRKAIICQMQKVHWKQRNLRKRFPFCVQKPCRKMKYEKCEIQFESSRPRSSLRPNCRQGCVNNTMLRPQATS